MDASALSIKTNVGTTLSKDANGTFDCTIKPSESIRLSVSGNGRSHHLGGGGRERSVHLGRRYDLAHQDGHTTVTASVGGAVLSIIVRIK